MESGMIKGNYSELGPDDNWRGLLGRPLEFITREASQTIPD